MSDMIDVYLCYRKKYQQQIYPQNLMLHSKLYIRNTSSQLVGLSLLFKCPLMHWCMLPHRERMESVRVFHSGKCKFCQDKPRFGGEGKLKQCCIQIKCKRKERSETTVVSKYLVTVHTPYIIVVYYRR